MILLTHPPTHIIWAASEHWQGQHAAAKVTEGIDVAASVCIITRSFGNRGDALHASVKMSVSNRAEREVVLSNLDTLCSVALGEKVTEDFLLARDTAFTICSITDHIRVSWHERPASSRWITLTISHLRFIRKGHEETPSSAIFKWFHWHLIVFFYQQSKSAPFRLPQDHQLFTCLTQAVAEGTCRCWAWMIASGLRRLV